MQKPPRKSGSSARLFRSPNKPGSISSWATKSSSSGNVKPSPSSCKPRAMQMFLDHLTKIFSSMRLTVVCLGLGLVLVFIGTLAQVDLGLYKAQNEFFRSFFIFWGPQGASWKIPVFPGGYLIGGVLLINLVAAHFMRFAWTRKKAGIWMVHVGVILLLLGQLLTDMLS